MTCPLCRTHDVSGYCRDERRDYYSCRVCGLVFVPQRQFLSREEEKDRYDLHRNSPEDPGYRRFLNRMFLPLQQWLAPGSEGLDFGSGPGPTLSRMFEEAGHSMSIFDPFYANAPSLLEQQYHFITATEVVEHLRDPMTELQRLWSCLKEGGLLGIMTAHLATREAFPRWYYKNDPTHVCFYSRETFAWLGRTWGAGVTFTDDDVVFFRKRAGLSGQPGAVGREASL